MKREILFRGKRKDNGEWVNGDLIKEYDDTFIGWICSASDGDPTYCMTKVDPETVGQFTGLVDKSGNKVFEGDIVIATSESGFDHGKHTNKFFLVYWFDDNGAWYIRRDYTETERETLHPLKAIVEMLSNCDVKIAGNIHDNPDLIKYSVS